MTTLFLFIKKNLLTLQGDTAPQPPQQAWRIRKDGFPPVNMIH